MAAGMRDVAAAASVSVGTVSNVLNSPHKVAPATVARVHAAIDKLGFVRNDAARQLKAQRSRCVALLVLDIGNPFFTSVARGAEHRASQVNLTVLFGTSDDDAGRERSYIDAADPTLAQNPETRQRFIGVYVVLMLALDKALAGSQSRAALEILSR